MCVSFHAVRRYVVESLQPALSTVEAYYDPSMRAEAMMAVAENAETRELTPPAVRACVCVAVFAGEGVAGVRVAVCGSNGFDTEPRDSPNEPHASPPAGFPSPFNKGQSPLIEISIETLSRVHTPTSGARGFKGAALLTVATDE